MSSQPHCLFCPPRLVVAVALAMMTVALLGCGSRHPQTYPAGGKVVFQDGSPMPGGMIELEWIGEDTGKSGKAAPNARAAIGPDGSFRLTTFKEFDGALPGRHRVLVRPPVVEGGILADGQPEWARAGKSILDPKFEHYESSGLEVTIDEASNDNLTITVGRPNHRGLVR